MVAKRIFDVLRKAARRNDLARNQSGNTAVEMALLGAPLFLFVFAIINAGHALWLQTALEYSVTQAARCATLNPGLCSTASQVAAYAAGQAGGGFDSAMFSFLQTSCGNQVSATYPLSTPFTGVSLSLSARACYPVYPL